MIDWPAAANQAVLDAFGFGVRAYAIYIVYVAARMFAPSPPTVGTWLKAFACVSVLTLIV